MINLLLLEPVGRTRTMVRVNWYSCTGIRLKSQKKSILAWDQSLLVYGIIGLCFFSFTLDKWKFIFETQNSESIKLYSLQTTVGVMYSSTKSCPTEEPNCAWRRRSAPRSWPRWTSTSTWSCPSNQRVSAKQTKINQKRPNFSRPERIPNFRHGVYITSYIFAELDFYKTRKSMHQRGR